MHYVFRRQKRKEECADHHKRDNDRDSDDDDLEAVHSSCGPSIRGVDLTTLVLCVGVGGTGRPAVPSKFIRGVRQLRAIGRSARSRTFMPVIIPLSVAR